MTTAVEFESELQQPSPAPPSLTTTADKYYLPLPALRPHPSPHCATPLSLMIRRLLRWLGLSEKSTSRVSDSSDPQDADEIVLPHGIVNTKRRHRGTQHSIRKKPEPNKLSHSLPVSRTRNHKRTQRSLNGNALFSLGTASAFIEEIPIIMCILSHDGCILGFNQRFGGSIDVDAAAEHDSVNFISLLSQKDVDEFLDLLFKVRSMRIHSFEGIFSTRLRQSAEIYSEFTPYHWSACAASNNQFILLSGW